MIRNYWPNIIKNWLRSFVNSHFVKTKGNNEILHYLLKYIYLLISRWHVHCDFCLFISFTYKWLHKSLFTKDSIVLPISPLYLFFDFQIDFFFFLSSCH